jgi:hypothetical protein
MAQQVRRFPFLQVVGADDRFSLVDGIHTVDYHSPFPSHLAFDLLSFCCHVLRLELISHISKQ